MHIMHGDQFELCEHAKQKKIHLQDDVVKNGAQHYGNS